MALLSRECVLAIEAEGTPGTAETAAAADAVFFAYFDPSQFSDDVPVIERPAMTGGMHAPSLGARMGTLTFEVDMAGKGAAGVPVWASTALVACGATVSSQTYSFGLTSVPHTVSMYADGLLRKLVGALGTVQFVMRHGQLGRARFTFTGKLAVDADSAILAPTYESVQPPRFAAGTCTLGGTALRTDEIVIDLGASVKLLEDPTDVTGYKHAVITSINPSATVGVEADLVATKNWQSLQFAGTAGTLSVVLGTSANNILTFTGTSNWYVVASPTGNRDGIVTRDLVLRPEWTGASGTSPMTLAFT
jgi:hypothetical protein